MATDSQKIAELRDSFGPDGEFAVCEDDDCGHAECEAGRHVLSIID